MALFAENFNDSDFTFTTLSGDEVELSGFNSDELNVVIPSEVTYGGKSYKVVSIGEAVFKNKSITSVSLPPTVTRVGNEAFQRCMNLTKVTGSENVTYIGSQAFATCRELEEMAWPTNLTYVGTNAFLYATSYKGEITIGKGAEISSEAFSDMWKVTTVTFNGQPKSVGVNAFQGLEGLTTLNVKCTTPPAFTPQEQFLAEGWDGYEPITANITLYVPTGSKATYEASEKWNVFEAIEEKDFDDVDESGVDVVVVPDDQSREYEVVNDSFNDDNTIVSLNVEPGKLSLLLNGAKPRQLTLAGKLNGDDIIAIRKLCGSDVTGGLNGNATLEWLDIYNCEIVEGGDPYYYNNNEVNYTERDVVGSNMFTICKPLKYLRLPKYAVKIGHDAMAGCDMLSTVLIGDYVTEIGELAFYDDQSLETISLPDGVKSLSATFYNCQNLKSVKLPANLADLGWATFYYCLSLDNLVIPDNVTTLGDLSFFQCRSLSSIHIPEGVNSIQSSTFGFNYALQEFDVDDNNATYADIDGVLYNKTLTTLKMYPLGRTDAQYVVPTGTVTIQGDAFSGCGLEQVDLGDDVEIVESGAFSDCGRLGKAILSSKLNRLDIGAFAYCKQLTEVVSPAVVPPTCVEETDERMGTFTGVDLANCMLTVQPETEDAYRSAPVWKEFGRIVSTGIDKIAVQQQENGRYGVDGKRITSNRRGINIVIMSDGSVKKQLVK